MLLLLAACAPAASEPTGPGFNVQIPTGPEVRVMGARSLLNPTSSLQMAVNGFYTSTTERLEPPVMLENVTANSLEVAFRNAGVIVQSRSSYLGVQLRTWPLGTAKHVLAVVLEADRVAWLAVHRADVNAPFDGREIAKRLARDSQPTRFVDAEKLGRELGFHLQAPTVSGFEYELSRESKTEPDTDDVFSFNVNSLQARYVEKRPRRFPPASGESLNAQLGANLLKLMTKPRRMGSGPQLGLEVASLIDHCNLTDLSESEARYDCDGKRFSLPTVQP